MVDFEGVKSRERRSMDDEYWVKLARENPIHFICKSEPEFFDDRNGLISLNRSLERFDGLQEFADEVYDALRFRTMDFKRSRYYGRKDDEGI